jgi:hypothetical protein
MPLAAAQLTLVDVRHQLLVDTVVDDEHELGHVEVQIHVISTLAA